MSVHPLRDDNYVDNLAVEERIEGDGPVTSQLITYLNAGVEILGRGALQVSFPIVLFQDGNQTYHREIGLNQSVDLKTATPMDLRVDARFVALELDERRFRLGLTGAVFVPIGNSYSFAGDRGVSSSFGLGAEYDFKDFVVTLNTGVAIRPRAAPRARRRQRAHVRRRRLRPLLDGKLRLGAEIFGSFGLLKETAGELDASPIEWQLNSKMFLTKDKAVYVRRRRRHPHERRLRARFPGVALVGGSFGIADSDARSPGFNYVITAEKDTDGDGYPDVIDLCPEDPEDGKQPKPSDGCPDMPDRDGDGIPDVVDKCPDDPEDKDGIDDHDGCPEEDADQDGIPDAEDKCPKSQGRSSSKTRRRTAAASTSAGSRAHAEIEIMKQVEFEFDSSQDPPAELSDPRRGGAPAQGEPRDQAAQHRGAHRQPGHHRLQRPARAQPRHRGQGLPDQQGHSVGAADLRRLRLRRPLVSNDTPDGRQRNRRVEFHIKSQSIEGR